MPDQNINQILASLKASGSQLVDQLTVASKSAYADFLSQLGDVSLSDQQRLDIAWATSQLTAAAVLAIGADAATLAILNQARLDGLAVVSSIEAVVAKNGEDLFKNAIVKALSIAQAFVLNAEQAVIVAALAAIPK